MTGGMAKYWIIPRVGDKELLCVVINWPLAVSSFLMSFTLKRI